MRLKIQAETRCAVDEFSIFSVMSKVNFIGIFFIALVSCSSTYNLTDRSGNTFVIEDPELETGGNLEYRAGSAVIELEVKDIVSLSVPAPTQRIFDGRLFYPATLKLEDTLSVPVQGFICIEGIIIAKNAGKKFSIPLANISELSRPEEEKEGKKEEEKKEEEPKQEETEQEKTVEKVEN